MNPDKLTRFKKWLQDRGCEILPNTNQYEVIRWKGKKVGVIYTSGNTSGEYARNARDCFNGNKSWNGGKVSTGRYGNYKRQKEKLIERDGTCCFYCGLEMGEDITVEHLISLTASGPNTLANMVLAHRHCNQQAGNKSVADKVNMAIKMRGIDNQQ